MRAAAKDEQRQTFDEAKADDKPKGKKEEERADGKGNLSWNAVKQIALPYWTDDEEKSGARWRLAGVLGMTLATTGIRRVSSLSSSRVSSLPSSASTSVTQTPSSPLHGGRRVVAAADTGQREGAPRRRRYLSVDWRCRVC